MLREHALPPHQEHPTEEAAVKTIRFVEGETNTDAEENMKAWKSSRAEVSPPTPGVDDTPYIQFAIDQLTRDEELTGKRRDGLPSGDVSPIEEDPASVVHNEDYIEPVSPQEPERRSTGQLAPPLMPRGKSTGIYLARYSTDMVQLQKIFLSRPIHRAIATATHHSTSCLGPYGYFLSLDLPHCAPS